MNDNLLLLVNGWAGKNSFFDGAMFFCAVYLIFVVFFIGVVCLAYYVKKREWKPVMYFCAALIVTFIFMQLLEFLNLSNRPFTDHVLTQLVPHDPGASFPSNHTTSGAAVALGVLFFTRFKKIGAGLFAAACVIGFSRVFVGVHYPFDIAGGLVAALAGVGLVAIVKKIIDTKKLSPVASGTEK